MVVQTQNSNSIDKIVSSFVHGCWESQLFGYVQLPPRYDLLLFQVVLSGENKDCRRKYRAALHPNPGTNDVDPHQDSRVLLSAVEVMLPLRQGTLVTCRTCKPLPVFAAKSSHFCQSLRTYQAASRAELPSFCHCTSRSRQHGVLLVFAPIRTPCYHTHLTLHLII